MVYGDALPLPRNCKIGYCEQYTENIACFLWI